MKHLLTRIKFLNRINKSNDYILWVGPFASEDGYVEVGTKDGECRLKVKSAVSNFKPSIVSAIDKHSWFLNSIKNNNIILNGKLLSKYESAYKHLYIQTKYGITKITPSNLLRNRTPGIKSSVDKTSYFINMIREIHGKKYNYSKLKYNGIKSKVTIICPVHGEFQQTAEAHLCGRGCDKCARENTSNRGQYSVLLAERYKNEYIKTKAKVYLVKFNKESEKFYKIGITKYNTKQRFRGYEKAGFKYSILKEVNTNLYNAIHLETELHSLLYNNRFTSRHKFDGYTECFSKINLLDIKL